MAYATPKPIARTYPEKGCYYATQQTGITAGNYPTDGEGGISTSADAIWTNIGLSDGDFEVELCYVEVPASTIVTATDRGSTKAIAITPGKGNLNIRMRNGFTLETTAGALGGTFGFKVHVYRQPSSY